MTIETFDNVSYMAGSWVLATGPYTWRNIFAGGTDEDGADHGARGDEPDFVEDEGEDWGLADPLGAGGDACPCHGDFTTISTPILPDDCSRFPCCRTWYNSVLYHWMGLECFESGYY